MEKIAPSEDLDLIFLIDRSGSMYGSEEDTMGGFNSFIQKERKKELNTKVTTILFDDRYEVLYERKSIEDVGELTEGEYYVRGSTALLDAIGKTITTLNHKIENKVLFVIMTDGMENASVEYSKSQIRNMINNHTWEFIFIGADIDSYSEAGNIGIRKSRVANYSKSKQGIEDAYCSIERAADFTRADINLEENDWKEDLRKYD